MNKELKYVKQAVLGRKPEKAYWSNGVFKVKEKKREKTTLERC